MPFFLVAFTVKPTPAEQQAGASEKVLFPPEPVFVASTLAATEQPHAAIALFTSSHPLPKDIDAGRIVPFVKAL